MSGLFQTWVTPTARLNYNGIAALTSLGEGVAEDGADTEEE